jgi:hypothetical protein
LPGACDSLLDDATTKVGIHQTAFRARHSFTKRGIGNPLLPRKAFEPAILENAGDGGSPASFAIYNT